MPWPWVMAADCWGQERGKWTASTSCRSPSRRREHVWRSRRRHRDQRRLLPFPRRPRNSDQRRRHRPSCNLAAPNVIKNRLICATNATSPCCSPDAVTSGIEFSIPACGSTLAKFNVPIGVVQEGLPRTELNGSNPKLAVRIDFGALRFSDEHHVRLAGVRPLSWRCTCNRHTPGFPKCSPRLALEG